MNSSIIMFSNMFSDSLFYKHFKPQSLLQCTALRRSAVAGPAQSFLANPGNFCRRRTNGTKSGLAAGGLAGYGPRRRSCFPGRVQTWPRFGGAFSFGRPPAASGIFRPTARFSLSGLMQRAYSANARRSRASRGRSSDRLLPVSLPRRQFAL
ncbi:hypothetical protein EFQ99_12900 [Rhizobium vallis]|uniref:Uncharacterized protein n=1 Tax=Rhizobium vallis TaxID=634290 RepID=A0A3S0Y6Q4_9HYPH|nr:hypothetical protein EFQ99_12900 [Rhizobium vallis]